jgi:hypothetical protein
MSRFVPMRARRALFHAVVASAVVTAPLTVVAAPAFAEPVAPAPASPVQPADQLIREAHGWAGGLRWHHPGFGGWHDRDFHGWHAHGWGWRFPSWGAWRFPGFGAGWHPPGLGWLFSGWDH